MKGKTVIKIVREAAVHLCIICGIAFIVIQILDWYNPFMDFMGRSAVIRYLLCAGAITLGVMYHFRIGVRKKKPGNRKPGKRKSAKSIQ